MISKGRKALYAGLLLIAAVSGVPQLLGGDEEENPSAPEGADGGQTNLAVTSVDASSEGEFSDDPQGEEDGELPDPQALDVKSIQESLDLVENFAPAKEERDLEKMLRSWMKAEQAVRPEGPTKSKLEAMAEGSDPLLLFLQANPLKAIIHGADRTAAMFGGEIFNPGDSFLFGKVKVQSVLPRKVLLDYEGEIIQVDLPPFKVKPRKPAGEQEEGKESDQKKEESPKEASSQESTEGGITDKILETLEKQ
ncbi:MAG: hypothetical protein DWQ01_17085 [Planctomycetota bacterium]|nr:MAG: hypothetical protein DWQ01_17085 [Planctomycetota bacterium]